MGAQGVAFERGEGSRKFQRAKRRVSNKMKTVGPDRIGSGPATVIPRFSYCDIWSRNLRMGKLRRKQNWLLFTFSSTVLQWAEKPFFKRKNGQS